MDIPWKEIEQVKIQRSISETVTTVIGPGKEIRFSSLIDRTGALDRIMRRQAELQS